MTLWSFQSQQTRAATMVSQKAQRSPAIKHCLAAPGCRDLWKVLQKTHAEGTAFVAVSLHLLTV